MGKPCRGILKELFILSISFSLYTSSCQFEDFGWFIWPARRRKIKRSPPTFHDSHTVWEWDRTICLFRFDWEGKYISFRSDCIEQPTIYSYIAKLESCPNEIFFTRAKLGIQHSHILSLSQYLVRGKLQQGHSYITPLRRRLRNGGEHSSCGRNIYILCADSLYFECNWQKLSLYYLLVWDDSLPQIRLDSFVYFVAPIATNSVWLD